MRHFRYCLEIACLPVKLPFDSLAALHALAVVMFYFGHLGYQVGRVDERLGSISPGNDCFYMRPASL